MRGEKGTFQRTSQSELLQYDTFKIKMLKMSLFFLCQRRGHETRPEETCGTCSDICMLNKSQDAAWRLQLQFIVYAVWTVNWAPRDPPDEPPRSRHNCMHTLTHPFKRKRAKLAHTPSHSRVRRVASALHLFRARTSSRCFFRSSPAKEIKEQTLLPWELPSQCGHMIIICKPDLDQGATFEVNEQRGSMRQR